MKALFVHDHKFKVSSGVFYTSGSLSSKVWLRYLKSFKTLTVVGRNGGDLFNTDDKYSVSSFDNVTFYLMPDTLNFRGVLFGDSYIKKECKRLIASHDAVIARLPSRLGTMFIKEAISQKKPYAVEVVGSAWDALWNHGSFKGKLFAPLLELSTKKLVSQAPFVLYVTEHYLQQRYPCKKGNITFCSNAEINAVNVEILDNRLSKINKLNFLDDKVIFGLIGSYSADYKGIDVAVKALALLSPDLRKWEFQIVGDGDPSKYIELARKLKVSEKVKIIGRVPSGESVYNWLDSVDVYLQPSLVEGLPRALVEAMSRGCPALGSDAGGIPELLSNNEISKSGSHTQLANCINQLLESKAAMEAAAKNNFERAKNYYSNKLIVRREKFWTDFSFYVEQSLKE